MVMVTSIKIKKNLHSYLAILVLFIVCLSGKLTIKMTKSGGNGGHWIFLQYIFCKFCMFIYKLLCSGQIFANTIL